ncbi:MAG TPA: spermidine/putrescine ABC transporter substrate-binding protein [Mycobacterium sp.]|nr:spermidine/putrescine ABC transporter substrate-binding protein [Mycobacterium sp.]
MAVPDRSGPNQSGPNRSRRQFLQRTALLAAGAPVLAGLLDACARNAENGPPEWPANLTIAAPDRPVTWDITADNRPIPDGLGPEQDATLKLYSYAGYISTEAIESFQDTYGARVEVSTFNHTDEALVNLRKGDLDVDVYTPGYDQIGRLTAGGLLRPLNHSYLPNLKNLWPVFSNPWYDQEGRFSVPYTVYTTGIAWRSDQIRADLGALRNPYESLWDPAFKNQTAVLDDWHTAMAMVLLKLGITDVNTSSAEDLIRVGEALAQLKANTAPAVTVTMFSDLPAGVFSLSQMWSGDIINARNFLPEGVSPDILRYWFPADGKGLVENDLMVLPRGGNNPVLAHLFINHMLDPDVAAANFAAIGFQPPQVSIDPDSLVQSGVIPETLKSAIVRPEYFDVGYRILELDRANDEAWHRVWNTVKLGRP